MTNSTRTVQWRFRAEEARNLAEVILDEKAKRTMLRIAAGYDRLAEHTASLAATGLPTDEGEPTLLTDRLGHLSDRRCVSTRTV